MYLLLACNQSDYSQNCITTDIKQTVETDVWEGTYRRADGTISTTTRAEYRVTTVWSQYSLESLVSVRLTVRDFARDGGSL
jgi:hypothetical protein